MEQEYQEGFIQRKIHTQANSNKDEAKLVS